MSSIIAIDVGNTSLSAAQFPAPVRACTPQELPMPRAVWQCSAADLEFETLARWLPDGPCQWLIGSVNDEIAQRIRDCLREFRAGDTARLLNYRDFPMELDVDAKEQVGIDRLAAAMAANVLRNPARPAIVIDAGSAVTIDVVSSDGVFRGGHIFPGMQLSLSALAHGTDRLPLLSPVDRKVFHWGKNTRDAMQAGVFWAALGAIQEIVYRLQAELRQDCDIVVTGGDIVRLLPHLNFTVRHEPHLVLAGLAMANTGPAG